MDYESWHKKSLLQKKIINNKNFTYRFLIDVLDRYLPKNPRVLDVGCGVGTIDFFISKKVKSVLGIDISEHSIKLAGENSKLLLLKNLNYKSIDLISLRTIKKFDVVICSEVLEHLKRDIQTVQKIYRLLKPGGTLIVSVPLRTAPLYKLGILKKFDKRVGHLRRYSVEGLVEILKKARFGIKKVEKTEGVFRNFLFTFEIGSIFVKVANRFGIVSDIFTFIDNLLGEIFGFSNVYIIAHKK